MSAPLVLLRTDRLLYLEKLQKGKLFMFTSMHYQNMETQDMARKDYLDGSIPDSGKYLKVTPPPEVGPIQNPHFTEINCYIKCFHQYMPSDLQQIDQRTVACKFSDETCKSIRSFGNDYAMIVLGPQFVQQFENACEQNGLAHGYGSVCYMTDEQYEKYENELVQGIHDRMLGKAYSVPQPRPALCKPAVFCSQQEFRFYLFHQSQAYQQIAGKTQVLIPNKEDVNKLIDQPYILDVGSLEEISMIIPTDALLKNPLYIHLLNDGKIQISI